MKNLKFYPICKLILSPVTVSWMLAEGMRLQGQRQGTIHCPQQQQYQHFCTNILSPNSHRAMPRGPDGTCQHSGLCYRRGAEGDTSLSGKSVTYMNILLKIVQNTRQAGPRLQDVLTCRKSENCLWTSVHSSPSRFLYLCCI